MSDHMTCHVVMWSGGITSWATARHVIDRHGTDSVTLLFADTLIEDEDLYVFNDQASTQLGVPITRVADGRTPWQVFEDRRWLGNTRIAQCSHDLKQKPCRTWLQENTDPANTVVYVGIDWTETHRLPGITAGWSPWAVDAPLTRPPYTDKENLIREAKAAGLQTPRMYDLGFQHANCGGTCVKGGQTQWARVLEVYPDRYARAEKAEQKMRRLLGKDVSILRDRRGGQTKPLTLATLRRRIEESSKELDPFDEGGCGCFTESDTRKDDMSTTQDKPRGKCTGCAFEYQLAAARSGDHKGSLVIRKHNSRTGPGLCSGAGLPPREDAQMEAAEPTEVADPAPEPKKHCRPGGCRGCCGCSVVCTKHPCGDPEGYAVSRDRKNAGDGGSAVVPETPADAGDGVPGVDGGAGRSRVRADQRGGSTGEGVSVGVSDLGGGDPGEPVNRSPLPEPVVRQAGSPGSRDVVGEHAEAVGGAGASQREEDALPTGTSVRRDEHGVRVPGDGPGVPDLPTRSEQAVPVAAQGAESVMFADPTPVAAEMAPVSGQPEPDRDKWLRYLIHGKPHTRATTFAKLGSSTYALGEWNERMLIKGLVERPDLLAMAHGLDVRADKQRLNAIADDAQTHAGNKVAANIGTSLHAFTERLDAGLITLDEVPPMWRARCKQYLDAVAAYGLRTQADWIERTTAVRADQVSAPLPVAGTLDRIWKMPNGDLVIGDLKSGRDLSYSWAEIAVQLAVYAHGVNTFGLFDWRTKTWQEECHVRTDFAIVMHLPAEGDGCDLYRVDLVKGWEYAQVSGRVQSRQKDKSIAGALTTLDVQATAPVAVETPEDSPLIRKAMDMVLAASDAGALARLYEYAQVSGKFTAYQLEAVKRWCAERYAELYPGA